MGTRIPRVSGGDPRAIQHFDPSELDKSKFFGMDDSAREAAPSATKKPDDEDDGKFLREHNGTASF